MAALVQTRLSPLACLSPQTHALPAWDCGFVSCWPWLDWIVIKVQC